MVLFKFPTRYLLDPPSVALEDEPTSGLDAHSSLELMNIMKRLSSKVSAQAVWLDVLFDFCPSNYCFICHPTVAGDSTNILLNFTLHD